MKTGSITKIAAGAQGTAITRGARMITALNTCDTEIEVNGVPIPAGIQFTWPLSFPQSYSENFTIKATSSNTGEVVVVSLIDG